jgi:hypothetical protein
MTLGCGGYGGNITSDNISPKHLLNIKRLAYELAPVASRWDRPAGDRPGAAAFATAGTGVQRPAARLQDLPSAPARPAPTGISVEALSRRVDEFLSSRGYKGDGPVTDPGRSGAQPDSPPLDFVCEDDVRRAIQAGRKLIVSERAIVTPAARDLGEQHRVFSVAPFRSA